MTRHQPNGTDQLFDCHGYHNLRTYKCRINGWCGCQKKKRQFKEWKINNRSETGHALLSVHIQWSRNGWAKSWWTAPGSRYYTPFIESRLFKRTLKVNSLMGTLILSLLKAGLC